MTIIPIKGMIGWDVTPQDIASALKEADGEEVMFEVASGGGFVAPGLDIFNQIRNYPGKTTAKLTGYAMSMASYIPLSADRIVAEDNAVYMIHNARGGVFGDHNDILKHGAYMKGLSGVLAARYAKRTGKSLAEIQELMDDETFFFGEDMVTEGFVDEILKTDGDDDKDSAVAVAQAAFEDVEARMSSDPAAAKADMSKAAAMLDSIVATVPNKETDGNSHHNPKKEEQMALAELLSANPSAKAEHEAALATARAEGDQSGRDAMASTIKRVSPFLASKEYPDIIGKTALNVLTGESEMVELTSAVAAVDAVREDQKGQAAADDDTKETKGEQTKTTTRKEGEPASTQADLDEEIAAFKEEG